jgi:hypothetical protein
MHSIKERLRRRSESHDSINAGSELDTVNRRSPFPSLQRISERLADPRNWPELRDDRALLNGIVDDPEHFTPQNRALAWHILTTDPRFCPRLKRWATLRARHQLNERARSDRAYKQHLAESYSSGGTSEDNWQDGPTTGRTEDGVWDTALRECFSSNGVRVILEYPELTGKALRDRIYRFVADDLQVSVLEFDPCMTMAERKQAKRIRVRRIIEERWARKWDEEAQEWKPCEDVFYILVVVPERDLVSSVDDEDAESAHPMDTEGTPLWVERPALPSCQQEREEVQHQFRKTAQSIQMEIQPLATTRQLRAAQRRADGEQLTANERQALCELRRKVKPMGNEVRRTLGWRDARNQTRKPSQTTPVRA